MKVKKDMFRHTKAERSYHQQSHTTNMLKEVFQAEEKMIPDEIWISTKKLRALKKVTKGQIFPIFLVLDLEAPTINHLWHGGWGRRIGEGRERKKEQMEETRGGGGKREECLLSISIRLVKGYVTDFGSPEEILIFLSGIFSGKLISSHKEQIITSDYRVLPQLRFEMILFLTH